MNLPDHLIRTLHDIHDDAGEWLAALDAHVADYETRWHIRVTGLVEDLSYNVVATAQGEDGTPYILKMSPPAGETVQEIAALRLYNGDGIARLIAADEAGTALLLERLLPGVSLWHSRDNDTATRTTATLMKRLWRPVPAGHPFKTLAQWAEGLTRLRQRYSGSTGPLPEPLVAQAEGIFAERLGSTPPVLLHGDLHHGNILSATRQPYLAIDPKGIVGDAGFEVGAFLRNPIGIERHPELRHILARRVAIFAEMLGMDSKEVAAWGVAQAVLSAWWSVDDHGAGYEGALVIAEVLGEWL